MAAWSGMNGHALPVDGPEMKAILAYIRYISAGVPVGQSLPGRGVPPLPLPDRPADPAHGAAVYREHCAVCHQLDGRGVRLSAAKAAETRLRYRFPPLWGPESYNDGAGMARAITAARFIRANMPFGIAHSDPVLSPADAFAVAVFIDGQPRPHLAGTERDYPDRSLKPPDAPYPPFIGPFTPDQHRCGPWLPIEKWQKDNAATLRDSEAAAGSQEPAP